MTDPAAPQPTPAPPPEAMPAGGPNDGETQTSMVEGLRAGGFTADLTILEDATVLCSACEATSEPEAVRIDKTRRAEGASDPDDEVYIAAVWCPACGAGGVLENHYGGDLEPGVADAMRRLGTGASEIPSDGA